MGGRGSGNGYRSKRRKTTVEESVILPMQSLRNRIYPGVHSILTWTWANGTTSSIGYSVSYRFGSPLLTLNYRWQDSEDIALPIELQSTPMQFGNRRWWFSCPLLRGTTLCGRRVGKLYLPPGEKYFGCRTCHDLTYQSSQKAHQLERLLARWGLGSKLLE